MEAQTREVYKNDTADYLLCLALDIGEGMLKNGGEIGRVEDTIERICYAYGAAHVEVFTIISVINAALRMPDGTYSSQMRRVKSTGTDLSRLEGLNALSREICADKPPLDEVDRKIHRLKEKKSYPLYVQLFAFGTVAASFTLFFGGLLKDSFVAFLVGLALCAVENFSPRRFNVMAKTLVSAFVAFLVAGVLVRLGVGQNFDTIMIGSYMIIVPGVAFGTAVRDLLGGDLLAGTLKTLQACLLALMIAFGYSLAFLLLGGVLL